MRIDLSKFYVWLLKCEFDKRLKARNVKNVTVNSLEPGTALDTGLQHVSEKISKVEDLSGKFYGNKKKDITPEWISASGQKMFWVYYTKVLETYLSLKIKGMIQCEKNLFLLLVF